MILSKLSRISAAIIMGAALASFPPASSAGEESVLIEFDRNKLCCIMNHMRLEEMLTDIDGINMAIFHQRKREVTIIYDKSKITLEQIVNHLVDITKVDRDVILLPGQKQ